MVKLVFVKVQIYFRANGYFNQMKQKKLDSDRSRISLLVLMVYQTKMKNKMINEGAFTLLPK